MLPIRCFSCNKIVGDKWDNYQSKLAAGKSSNIALDELGLKKYCCRRIMLGHVDIIFKQLKYAEFMEQK